MEEFVSLVGEERIVLGRSIVMLVHIRKDVVYGP
jgi:hypothetical protein